MKTALIALLLSVPVVGAEAAQSTFNFNFSGYGSGRYTMVSCDYAESLARDWMDSFGAKNLDVSCFGGIQPYGTSPLSLRVSYTAPGVDESTPAEKLVIKSGSFGSSSCDFDTSMMRDLLRDFTNVTATRKHDACFGPGSTYRYEFSVKLPN